MDNEACLDVSLKEFCEVLPMESNWLNNRDLQSDVGKSVLLVDDEPLVIEYLKELLSSSGYEVTSASGPREAIETLKHGHKSVDVVITDQSMPGMTGINMAAVISKLFGDIPVILMTGYSDNLSREDVTTAGITLLLHKPMKGVELLSAVDKVMSTRFSSNNLRGARSVKGCS